MHLGYNKTSTSVTGNPRGHFHLANQKILFLIYSLLMLCSGYVSVKKFISLRTTCAYDESMKETKLFWGSEGIMYSDRIKERIKQNEGNRVQLLVFTPDKWTNLVKFVADLDKNPDQHTDREYVIFASRNGLSIPDEIFSELGCPLPADLPKSIRRWYTPNVARFDGRWGERMTIIPLGTDFSYRICHISHAFIAGFSFWTLLRPWTWFEFTESAQDQESLLLRIASRAPPLHARKRKVYSDWMFNGNYGRSFPYVKDGKTLKTITRKEAYEKIKNRPIFEFPSYRWDRARAWTEKSMYAFELSLPGFGMDCFRIWEALALGIIVITVASPLDPLFAGLPVVIIDDLDEITDVNLDLWLERYGPRFHDEKAMAKITNEYWVDRVLESASN